MARIISRLLASTLLGAITTVGVAWSLAGWQPLSNFHGRGWLQHCSGFSYYSPPHQPQRPLSENLVARGRTIGVTEFVRTGTIRRYWLLHPDAGEGYTGPISLTLPTSKFDDKWMLDNEGNHPRWGFVDEVMRDPLIARREGIEDARGWPCLALWCAFDEARGFLSRTNEAQGASGGIRVGAGGADPSTARALPYFPIWRGFMIDSAIYAACWFAVVSCVAVGIRRLRARNRIRRGLCPTCKYSLAGNISGICPECGTALVPPRTSATVTKANHEV